MATDRKRNLIAQKIKKWGNSYALVIPKDEMEARGLREGDLVGFDPQLVEIRPAVRPAVRDAIARAADKQEAGLRYLADK